MPAEGQRPGQAHPIRDARGDGSARSRPAERDLRRQRRVPRDASRDANVAAVERVARSLKLAVETKPGFGAVEQADFHGNVHFTDGPQVAADAQRALYLVAEDQIDLSPAGEPGPVPRGQRRPGHRGARTIEFVLGTRKLKADTKVRSSMLPSKGTAAQAGSAAPDRPRRQGRLPSS